MKNEEKKIYIALKTISVFCNKKFQLIKDKEIPKDLPEKFLVSLLNSKIIKKG